MAVSEGRALVVGALIKHAKETGVVQGKQVTEETGLARQVVHHHLKQLTSLGHIQHFGNGVYGNLNVDRMVDDFTLNRNPAESSRPRATKLINEQNAAKLNAAIDFYQLTLGAIEPEKSNELKTTILDFIDETTKHLKTVRKYTAEIRPIKAKRRWRMLTFGRKAIDPEYDSWDYRNWTKEFPEAVAFAFGNLKAFQSFYEAAEANAEIGTNTNTKELDPWQNGE